MIIKKPILDAIYKQIYYCGNCEEYLCNKTDKDYPVTCKYCRVLIDWREKNDKTRN